MSLAIASIGTAVPEHHGDQELALSIAQAMCAETEKHDRALRAIYRRSGVRKRHTVLNEMSNGTSADNDMFSIPTRGSGDRGPTTLQRMQRYEKEIPSLAIRAAREALELADISANSLTHLITVSCTGFSAPGFDFSLINELALSPHVARTHVGYMGCHAALNGLRVARAFLAADNSARVLMCAAELCTLHLYYGWDAEKVIANALFADGAAALVAMPADRAAPQAWRVVDNGSTVLENSGDFMSWRIGNHGFEMTLSTDLPNLIQQKLRPWLDGWLDGHGLSIEDIGSWAIHPGGPRIVSSAAAAADLQPESIATSQEVLAQFGNMSSPTILFILRRLCELDAARPCVALAFGPGITVEAALIR
jgi:predicted naringenin-chalcone synthase